MARFKRANNRTMLLALFKRTFKTGARHRLYFLFAHPVPDPVLSCILQIQNESADCRFPSFFNPTFYHFFLASFRSMMAMSWHCKFPLPFGFVPLLSPCFSLNSIFFSGKARWRERRRDNNSRGFQTFAFFPSFFPLFTAFFCLLMIFPDLQKELSSTSVFGNCFLVSWKKRERFSGFCKKQENCIFRLPLGLMVWKSLSCYGSRMQPQREREEGRWIRSKATF